MKADVKEHVEKLVDYLVHEYEFKKEYKYRDDKNDLMKEANALDKPVMVIAPEKYGNKLRVWVYGGCIATISLSSGKVCIKDNKNTKINGKLKEYNADLANCEDMSVLYDYGKYLIDGYTDGQGCVYWLSDTVREKYANNDALGAYIKYSNMLTADDLNWIDSDFLNLSVFAAYVRWLNMEKNKGCSENEREKRISCPKHAGEKLIQ